MPAVSSEKIRAELGFGKDDPVIGLIGRISRDKGHLILLDAVLEILAAFPNAVFVFTGIGGGTVLDSKWQFSAVNVI